jgi:hypothetical protein
VTYYDIHTKIKEKNKEGYLYRTSKNAEKTYQTDQTPFAKQLRAWYSSLMRGNVVGECNTNIDRMREYFECSFNGTNNLGYNLTLLLTSDEKDMDYRKSIIRYH